MFEFPPGMKKSPRDGAFQPQLHFAGRTWRSEIKVINRLLAEYGSYIVGYRHNEPVRGTYGLELQFDDSAEGQAAKNACQSDYESLTSSLARTFAI